MLNNLKIYIFIVVISLVRAHTHDENSKCALTGVHKTRQTILESPNYPNNYPPDTCWDYVIRSPYRCPTKFHIQFLDFFLEASKDCENDYLAVGLDNIDDDMDVLCGQVVGIKKYHTPDGVLRLRFLADDSPWSTGKGFKLLITRLACEKEELLREIKDDDDDDTITVKAQGIGTKGGANKGSTNKGSGSNKKKYDKPNSEVMEIFRNLSGQEQHQLYPLPPLFGLNYPTQLPSPPYPGLGGIYLPTSESRGPIPYYPGYNIQNSLEKPCSDNTQQQQQLTQQQQSSVPNYLGYQNGNQLQSFTPPLNSNQQQNYFPNYLSSNQLQPSNFVTTNTNNQQQEQQQQSYLQNYLGFQNGNQQQTLITPNIGSNQVPASLYSAVNNAYLPLSRDQYIGTWPSSGRLRAYDGTSLEACCTSGFQQKRFYLSSPGFPRTIFSNILPNPQRRDCEFELQKSSPNVCRMNLEFKFFDFGQNQRGSGSFQGNLGFPTIESSLNSCTDDYIEIDNQRFCGCRSGNVYNAYWAEPGSKKLRMRMGYSGIPSGGFLLEVIQEECSETQFPHTTPLIPIAGPAPGTTATPGLVNLQQAQRLVSQQQQQQMQLQSGNYAGGFQDNYQVQQPYLQNRIQQPTNYPGQILNNPGLVGNFQAQNPLISPQQQQSNIYQNPLLTPQQQQQQQQIQQSNIYQNPLLTPQQQSNIYQPYPSQFGTNYVPNLQQDYTHNPFGLNQIRYARSYSDQPLPTPVTVVETNSTRKETYYTDSDSINFNETPHLSIAMSRSSNVDSMSSWDEEDLRAVNNLKSTSSNLARETRKCSFDMGDILRLSVDILWLTKPTCYAPQRNWFTNLLG